jgi:AraC-like DNA-binding protein
VRDAIAVANRYVRLADDSCSFWLESGGGRAVWRFELDWPNSVRQLVGEYLLGVLGMVARRLFGGALPAEEVWVSWSAPTERRAEYEHVLSVPTRFGAACEAVVLAESFLDQRLSGADPALAKLLDRHAQELLAKLPRADAFAGHVRRLMLEECRGGEPTMSRIARRLATTPSTLRRRLSDEQTSFKKLLDEARLQMAEAYLGDRSLTLTEIAFLLGYRDSSNFFKSFRRWTGKTPAEYRRDAG